MTRITGEVGISIKNHTIITNGYLFTDKAIKVFEKFPLDSIQITLDGTADRHNKLRALKGNNYPTYDKIVSNIGNILKQLANVTLHLRVNIDKTNVDDYFEIHKSFTNTFNNPNLIVYPGIIRLENEERTNIVEPAFGRWETANLLYELYSKGFLGGEIYPVQRRAKTCCAMCVNSFIIGPMGEIYKCWNDVSDRTRIIGHIKTRTLVIADYILDIIKVVRGTTILYVENVSSYQYVMGNVHGIMKGICITMGTIIYVNVCKKHQAC